MYHRDLTRDVVVHDQTRTSPGYTLFSHMWGKDAWLIDINGNIVNHWTLGNVAACHGKLLENGNLLWQAKGEGTMPEFAGHGTELVEYDWDSNEVWRYEDPGLNHDFKPLPNGNVMVNCYVLVPDDVAAKVQGGLPGSEREGKIWSCSFREVDRAGNTIWDWKLWEHLDLETDIICPLCPRSIWGYSNSIDVDKDGNVIGTLRHMNSVFRVNRQTGKIDWRLPDTIHVGHPHCARALDNGNILVFDNGLHRCSTEVGSQIATSRLIEVNPETGDIDWEYRAPDSPTFFTDIAGGLQRLPNGNTLACQAVEGRFIEVTPDRELVWDYRTPFWVDRPSYWGWTRTRLVFQAHRYAPDFPGFKGKDLDPDHWQWVVQRKSPEQIKEAQVMKRLESLGY